MASTNKDRFISKTAQRIAMTLATVACMGLANVAVAAELSNKQTQLIPIAAFTANGDRVRLKQALIDGLEKGLTVNEIKDVLVQMYAYTGFPRSLTGLGTLVNVLEERKAKNIADNMGRSASPRPEGKTVREFGTEVQTRIIGRPASGPVYELSPEIDTYLKEHLFGDIFASDLLTLQEREIATVSALASLPAPAQLQGHINGCLNVEVTPAQLNEFVEVLRKEVGTEQAKLAEDTLERVLKAREAQK